MNLNFKQILTRLILLVVLPTIIAIGYSSWTVLSDNKTENQLNIDNDKVNVNLYGRKQNNSANVVTKFYIPDKVTVTHNISATDENGNTVKTRYTNNIGNSYEDKDYDEIIQYYDVNDGVYTPIDQHNQNKGPEQIKSVKINVESWKETADSSQWGDVWEVGYNTQTPLRFYVNCDNNITGDSKYKVGDIFTNNSIPAERLVSENVEIDETTGSIITTRVYERVIVNEVHECVRGQKWIIMKYIYWSVFPTYQRRMVQTIQEQTTYEDTNLEKRYVVKSGSRLSPNALNVEGYTSCAFFSDESYSTLFDFSKPITTDINVYALFLNNQGNKETLSDLMQKNSNLAVYDQRRGGSGGSYDVISDPLYDTTTNTIFLKNTTIASGATTNFTFGESKVYLDPIEGTFNDSVSAHRTSTDTSISTEYSGTNYIGDDNCSLNIILTGDLTVNGTLNLGADIGGANDFTKFSYIKGMYAKIDLYGHNIYVDGGNLNAYGLIVDSVGTGKIIVKNNGSVKSTISVSDGRQINQVLVGLSKRQTPFSEYKFPYLQVPTYFYNGSTFSGYLKFELCRYGISNIIMNVVGPSNALFLWNDNVPENYVLFNPYRVEPISNLKDVNFLRQDYDLRNEFVFNANVKEIESLELTLEIEILTTVKGTLDFIRIDVPISTFFDLVLNDGFTMEISSKITFYPGSSFTVNKNATLKLTYRGSVKYDAQAMSYIPGEERYIAGGIMSYTNHIGEIANNGYSKNRFNIGIYNNEKFWNLTKTSNVNIYGNLIFDDTIDTTAKTGDGYYYLSGKINLSKNALDSIISNKNFIKTYDFKAELHSGLFIDSGHMGIEYLYEAATSYNCNCLISGDEAFVIDANKARKGSFDAKNGIFVKESDVDILNNEITYTNSTGEYFLCVDTDMYEDGSTGNDQSSRIDRNIVITEIKESNKSGRLIQTIDDKFYVYYCGLYIPVVSEMTEIINPSNGSTINANCRKFFSNNESDYAYASKYDSVILKYNSSSKIWAYSSFHE